MIQNKRELLLQAKLYRLLAMIFVLAGLFTFIILYLQHVEGRLLSALKEPITVTIVVFPFVPAIVLSLLAKSAENKYLSLREKEKKQAD